MKTQQLEHPVDIVRRRVEIPALASDAESIRADQGKLLVINNQHVRTRLGLGLVSGKRGRGRRTEIRPAFSCLASL